jgi:hypothetical protein
VFVQAWIGAEDKLPRRLRAVHLNDPAQLRHEMDLSDWHLDAAVASEFFESAKAASATRIPFASPKLSAGIQGAAEGQARQVPPPAKK